MRPAKCLVRESPLKISSQWGSCKRATRLGFWGKDSSLLSPPHWTKLGSGRPWHLGTEWDFLLVKDKVKSLKVVNDAAERGIALVQQFNAVLNKQQYQTQLLLQVVEQHRKQYSNSNKFTIMSSNSRCQHSLLKCNGKPTVTVARLFFTSCQL